MKFCYNNGTYGSKKSFVNSEHAAEEEGTRLDRKRCFYQKLFYQNESIASAALRAYRRMKNLRKGPMSEKAVKCMIRKIEKKTGSLDVAPGRGRRATESVNVEEVTIPTAEHLKILQMLL